MKDHQETPEIMGHSHSSSHKRLKSISSTKNYGEFTEVVDFEFSDTAVTEPPSRLPENPARNSKNNMSNNLKSIASNIENVRNHSLTSDRQPMSQVQYPKDLMSLAEHIKDVQESIDNMSSDEFYVYFPTLKDDLHNCWQKVYGIKEINSDTKLKKHEVIDHIRELLRKLNVRLQRRGFTE